MLDAGRRRKVLNIGEGRGVKIQNIRGGGGANFSLAVN